MANTTSGTVTFDKTFAVDDLIAEAYERIGSQVTSGYQLKSARRSLNILFQEWGNRGLHYWEVAETNIDLIKRKQYLFIKEYRDKNLYSDNILVQFSESFKTIRPFFNYMSDILTTDLNGVSII